MEGILARKYINDIKKELFRKTIHLCTAAIPFLLSLAYVPVMALLLTALVLYSLSELLRLKGINIPLVSKITVTAARKRDEGRFVLGPVTLVLGILLTAGIFQPRDCAFCGIYALAFGDGLASLVGKVFGTHKIPCTKGKSVEGSLACFVAIWASTLLLVPQTDWKICLVLALCGTITEVLPLKDFDNVLIPLLIAAVAHVGFGL